MCIEKLTQLGFTEKEAQIYFMLFRFGSTPVSTLAQRLGLKRATTYAALDVLCEKALVHRVNTDQGIRYLPLEPAVLLDLFEREKQALQFKLDLAKECVRDLESPTFSSIPESKRVLFHQGLESVRKGLKDFFTETSVLNILLSTSKKSSVGDSLRWLQESRLQQNLETISTGAESHLFGASSLLVLNDTVGFLVERAELELMVIRDPFYAQYVKHVLFQPYFSKMSVGASTSNFSPVKG